MSTQNGTGEGITNSNGTVSMVRTGCAFEEAVRKADKSVRTLLDQAAKNIDCGKTLLENPNAVPEDAADCSHSHTINIDPLSNEGATLRCLDCGRKSWEYSTLGKPVYSDGPPNAPGKRDCLKEADKIINGERQDSYGAPEDSFTVIAGYWNVFLAAKLKALGMDVKDLLSPLDTTNMMVLFKQARKLGQKPSRDNYVDSCGYEAIGADRLSE